MQRYFMAILYNLTLLSNRTKGNKNGLFNHMYVAKKIRQTQTRVEGRGHSPNGTGGREFGNLVSVVYFTRAVARS